MGKNNETKPQSIEALKFAAKETNYRWALGMVFILSTILGIVGGYFLCMNVITDTQAQAVSVFSSAVSKE